MRIAFEHVSFCYGNGKEVEPRRSSKGGKGGCTATDDLALDDVSFTLEDGQVLGIAGHTGSGKSTLIRHLNGLVHPTSGRVLIDGIDLADKQATYLARNRVGIVFQYPEQQLFSATVFDEIAFGPRNTGCSNEEVELRVRRALDAVHLSYENLCQQNPFRLSGGQMRRVALASILACQPEVIVFDEPTVGLDPATREEFLGLIAEMHEQGQGIIMVSHVMDELAYLCNRILVLNQGSVYTIGTPQEVFSHVDELKHIGLDAPEPHALALHLRSCGFDLPNELYDEESLIRDLVVDLARDHVNS